MKKVPFLLVLTMAAMSACKEGDDVAPITEDKISQTWLAVQERRVSDNWVQFSENGITTDWKIDTQFGSPLPITAIKFGTDKMFSWNVTATEDWDFIRENLPHEYRSTYNLSNDGKSVTLYSRFNYVGIVKTDTTVFQISIDADDRLVLANDEVELKFLNTFQY